MAEDRKVMNLRLDADLHARLVEYAKTTERSVNAAAVFAIRAHLDRIEQERRR